MLEIVKSSGFIVYHVSTSDEKRGVCFCKKIRVLLLFTKRGNWDFPKGGQKSVDGGDLMKTAHRELEEETGITCDEILHIEDGLEFHYSYPLNKRKRKKVSLFVCEIPEHVAHSELKHDPKEISTFENVRITELVSRFRFKEEIEVARNIVKHFVEKCSCALSSCKKKKNDPSLFSH